MECNFRVFLVSLFSEEVNVVLYKGSIRLTSLAFIFQNIPSSPYQLEELVNNIKSVDSIPVKLNLLTSLLKLFFKRPPECQKILGKLFKYYCGGIISRFLFSNLPCFGHSFRQLRYFLIASR